MRVLLFESVTHDVLGRSRTVVVARRSVEEGISAGVASVDLLTTRDDEPGSELTDMRGPRASAVADVRFDDEKEEGSGGEQGPPTDALF